MQYFTLSSRPVTNGEQGRRRLPKKIFRPCWKNVLDIVIVWWHDDFTLSSVNIAWQNPTVDDIALSSTNYNIPVFHFLAKKDIK